MDLSFLDKIKPYKWICDIILIIGGLNLGFLGLINVNILGMFGLVSHLIFIVIGLAAAYEGYLIYLERFKKS